MKIAAVLSASVLCLVSTLSAAKTTDTLNDPALALVVDGRNYPARVTDIMFSAAKNAKKDISYGELIDGLVDNQLMSRHAVKEMGRDALLQTDKVGFPPSVIIEDQYSTLIKQYYYKQIDATVRGLPGGSLQKLITMQLPRDNPSVKELMTLRDLGEVRLTPKQLELARKTTLATVTLPDGTTRDITWHEMYVRQNVQGRTRLMQEGDYGYLDAQVQGRTEVIFVDWWAERHSGLSAPERALLRTMLEEKFLRETYMLKLGVVTSMHEDTTPTLLKMQKQVTKAEIHAWYAKNKEEFRQVEKVRARHIRCNNEKDCLTARDAVEKGMDFSAAAKKYSIADSRNAQPAGSMGWVHRTKKNLSWLDQVTLIQHQGEMTRPIRSPEDARGNAVWEVVLVDERVEGYLPVDSESVRYQAAQEIAKKKLVEQYLKLREQQKAAADIRRNGALIKARDTRQAGASA